MLWQQVENRLVVCETSTGVGKIVTMLVDEEEGSAGGDKCADSGYIVKGKLAGVAHEWKVGMERKRGIK